jgi:glycine/D-amino acid oxidase-like deaminating enzyme
MVSLMNRSIDWMEKLANESGNFFHLNRRGYLYMTADPQKIPDLLQFANTPSKHGAGPLRIHDQLSKKDAYRPSPPEGFMDLPTGADLFLDPQIIQNHFPYLPEKVQAALHIRRAGWFSAQQMGMYLLEKARSKGVEIHSARVIDLEIRENKVNTVFLDDGQQVTTRHFINAAGPFIKPVAKMIGVELPVFSELHLKVAINDTLRIVPRNAPMLIWNDPQYLPWSKEERQIFGEEEDNQWLLREFPPGAHTRPEGGNDSDIILMLWGYHTPVIKPTWPIPKDPFYPEINIRGLVTMLPGMKAYTKRMPQPRIDGGYYTKTQENRPLIGPLPVEGCYIFGALSGFGLMAACAGGELIAAHVTDSALPPYAPAFELNRYQDPEYQELLLDWGDSGQL